MADLINATDSLNTGRVKINAIIEDASAAVIAAEGASVTAGEAKTTADSVQTQLDTIILDSGTSDAEVVQSRVDKDGKLYTNLKGRLDSYDQQLEQKADQTYVNTNLTDALVQSDFVKDTLTKITSFNREYYLNESNNIYTAASAVSTTSWWIVDNVKEFEFTLAPESKWLVIGVGANYSAYCVAVNLIGLTNRNIMKLETGASTLLDGTTYTAAQGVVGDVIKAKHEGNLIKLYKKVNSVFTLWFTVDTSLFVDVVNKCVGLAHTYQAYAYNSCTNFMNLNTLPTIELVAPPAANAEVISKWKAKKWVTIGDSITWYDKQAYVYWAGHESEIAVGYQSVVDTKVGGFTSILNKSASGTAMTDNGNVNAGVKLGKTVDYTLYDLVTIAHGTNDFKLDQPIGTQGLIGDTTFNLATFYGAYRSLIEYILTQKPTIKIVLMTPLQRDSSGYTVNSTNAAGHKMVDYVNAIKAIGQMYGIPVLDLYTMGGFTKLTLGTFTYDGLHPNNVGYAVVGDKLYNCIEHTA